MRQYLEKLNRNQKIVISILAPVLLFFIFYGYGKDSLDLSKYEIFDLEDSWGLWTIYICSLTAFYLYFFNTSIEKDEVISKPLHLNKTGEKVSTAKEIITEKNYEYRHVIPESYNFSQGNHINRIKEESMGWLSSNRSHNLEKWNIEIEEGKIKLHRYQTDRWFVRILPLIAIAAVTTILVCISAFLKIEVIMVTSMATGSFIFLVTAFKILLPSISMIIISESKLSTFLFKKYRLDIVDFNFSNIETHSEYFDDKTAYLITLPTDHQFSFVDSDKSNISTFDFNQLFGTNIEIPKVNKEAEAKGKINQVEIIEQSTHQVFNSPEENINDGINTSNIKLSDSKVTAKKNHLINFKWVIILFIGTLLVIGGVFVANGYFGTAKYSDHISQNTIDTEKKPPPNPKNKTIGEGSDSNKEVDYYLDGEPVYNNEPKESIVKQVNLSITFRDLNGTYEAKVRYLYDHYSQFDGVDLEDFDTFKSRMSSEPELRQEFFRHFSQFKGQNLGKNFNEFEEALGVPIISEREKEEDNYDIDYINNYRIFVGQYKSMEKALRIKEKLISISYEDISIENKSYSVYKVYISGFQYESAAKSNISRVNSIGVNAMVQKIYN